MHPHIYAQMHAMKKKDFETLAEQHRLAKLAKAGRNRSSNVLSRALQHVLAFVMRRKAKIDSQDTQTNPYTPKKLQTQEIPN